MCFEFVFVWIKCYSSLMKGSVAIDLLTSNLISSYSVILLLLLSYFCTWTKLFCAALVKWCIAACEFLPELWRKVITVFSLQCIFILVDRIIDVSTKNWLICNKLDICFLFQSQWPYHWHCMLRFQTTPRFVWKYLEALSLLDFNENFWNRFSENYLSFNEQMIWCWHWMK